MRILLLLLFLGACAAQPERGSEPQPSPDPLDYWQVDEAEEGPQESERPPQRRKKGHRTARSAPAAGSEQMEKLPPCQPDAPDKRTELLLKMDCVIETADKPLP